MENVENFGEMWKTKFDNLTSAFFSKNQAISTPLKSRENTLWILPINVVNSSNYFQNQSDFANITRANVCNEMTELK